MHCSTRPSVPLFAGSVDEPLLRRIAERQQAVLHSGRFILGPEVEEFEAEFADYLGVGHCVGVANGTEAITIALRALGVGLGDEVIVPAFTFFATGEAVVNAGATPVFCDVDRHTYCMTAATTAELIGPRTAALLPVHLFGNPAPMGELAELADRNGLALIEDAAQAAGARIAGTMAGGCGDAGTFSFYPSKNLGAVGDGGAIVTNSDEVAATARRLRFHGSEDKRVHVEVGYNSRLDELQAAALRVLLPRLDDWTAARRRVAADYARSGLGELVTLPSETEGAEACYHLYVVRTGDRDGLAAALASTAVGARPYYTVPLHKQPALAAHAEGVRAPEVEGIADEGLALPMGPALTAGQVEVVVDRVREALGGSS